MKILDSNEIINRINREEVEADASISVISLLEVLRGIVPAKRERMKELLEETYTTVGLDNSILLQYCLLYDGLKKEKTPLSDADLLIAATAICRDAPLKTEDRHYHRLEKHGLKLEDPDG